MGIGGEQFWQMTPREIKPYKEAYRMRREQDDTDMWTMGAYVMNAFGVVLANAFGKHSNAKYLEHPFSWRPPELTDEEIMAQTNALFKSLGTMQTAFEARHPKPTTTGEGE